MKKIIFVSIVLLLAAISSYCTAQDRIVIPKALTMAYDKLTRQTDGRPGKIYWQNRAVYDIRVNVDVKNKIISGHETISYLNNSPDSLSKIVVRLYQDIFKKGANRNSIVNVNPSDINEGVRINDLRVTGESVNPANSSRINRSGTIMTVKLTKKLAPGEKAELQIGWEFDFPVNTLIRMGTIDSSSLFVGQWYPQIAVYDDVYGWDTRSYNGMAEFYNDFSDFSVEISVPKGFMVWATGELQNMSEVLHPNYCDLYNKAIQSEKVTNVITEKDLEKGEITTEKNTWKYKAENVTDFAFGLSDHYLWDVCSVEVDKKNKRRTIVGVAYNAKSPNFNKVAEIARESVRSLSLDSPGVPYPFPYITVYNGDFGMEYPMITNVGAETDFGMTVYANSHEIAHAYFPFYVGTNETKNGWIDEGLTVLLPEKMQNDLEPTLDIKVHNTKSFSAYSGMEDEPALITPTFYLDPKVYFYLNYAKTEQALRMLELELGRETFRKCLLQFIYRWKYKHPTPYDYFNTFNDVSGRDLDWFWLAWYYRQGGIPDLSIKSAKIKNERINIIIENKGTLPMPVIISLYDNDKLVTTIFRPAILWKERNEILVPVKYSGKVTRIILGNNLIADSDNRDNLLDLD